MELEAFRKLSVEQKHKVMGQKGVLLCERRSPHFIISLYALHNFYVEIFFFKDSREFATFKPFDHPDELAPYLAEIDVAALLQ